MSKESGLVAAVIFLVLLASPFLYNAFSAPSHGPELTVHVKGDCVRDTAWMKRNHMLLLKHSRDDVVRDGVRKEPDGIKGCRSCHPYREEFCDQCHDYVGIEPECWSCHFYPESKTDINDEDDGEHHER